MASKQKSNLVLRVISALALMPPVLLAVYEGGGLFAFVLALAGAAMAWEWASMTAAASKNLLTAWLGGAVIFAVGLAAKGLYGEAVMVTLVFSSLSLVMVKRFGIWPMLGVGYLTIPLIALIWLRAQEGVGFGWLLWLLLAVWATDTFAYFAGRRFGKNKLAPKISPNKTREGLYGGMVGAAVVGAAIAVTMSLGNPLLLAVAGACIAVVAQAGDLFESGVKRTFDVKDSSNIIPGHGGVLDRLDGFLTAAPVLAVFLLFLN